MHDAHQTADIAGVAIGIPACGIDDHLCALEIVRGVECGHDHQRMVRDHMAIARKLGIAVAILDQLPCGQPVWIGAMPRSDIRNQSRDQTIARDHRQPHVDQVVDVGRQEGFGLHRGPELSGID